MNNKKIVNKKLFKLIGYTIVGIFLVSLVINSFLTMSKLKSSFKDEDKLIDSVPTEYRDLFIPIDKGKFIGALSYSNNFRNPFTTVDYENGKYCIIINKLKESNNTVISISERKSANVQQSKGFVYNVINENYFEVSYKSGKQDTPKNIRLTFAGDSFKTLLKNDSVAYYYLMFRNFSISYGKSGVVDLAAEVKGSSIFQKRRQPIEILFLRKNDNLYLLMMSVNQNKINLEPGSLYKIINSQ